MLTDASRKFHRISDVQKSIAEMRMRRKQPGEGIRDKLLTVYRQNKEEIRR